MAYIKLPRNSNYINRDYYNRKEFRRFRFSIGSNFQSTILLPAVRNDEPLIRAYLAHFLKDADGLGEFSTYINDLYLKHLYAETKLVHGLGDAEQWVNMLPPDTFKRIKERIDLEFATDNRVYHSVDHAVTLDLDVKNIKKLIVKVYELNTNNFYRSNGREIGTDINLDGLVANRERVYNYKTPPIRRIHRTFEFPEIKERGVYVIEFIGNGKSSRALVRKGTYRYLVRSSIAGQVFSIVDEANLRVKDASIWMNGHSYDPDENGDVTLPYSHGRRRQSIIISDGEFAVFHRTFTHETEAYSLAAAFHLERESLLKTNKTQILIRPVLTVNGTPVTLSVLEDVKLVITSTDREGVSATKEINDFKLFEDREATFEFKVPDKLASISFALTAKIQNLSQNKKINMRAVRSFTVNAIDRTEKVHDLHLGHTPAGYVIDVLGKTGETRGDLPVTVTLKHRDFKRKVTENLQTDGAGRIHLGALKDITNITVRGPHGTRHSWPVQEDTHSVATVVHGRAGDPVYIPFMGAAKAPRRSDLSLLEKRGTTFLADRFADMRIGDGFVEISELPAGDYDLLLKRSGARITLKIDEGREEEGYVLGRHRHLQRTNPLPLQISAVESGKETVTIHLKNATAFTRVHVAATRYVPAFPIFRGLSGVPFPGTRANAFSPPETQYLSGRDIGDEYRHVDNERVDKYVTDEFLVHTVYGCQLVITNPTSSRQKLDVLLQIPRGAMPVLNSQYTKGLHLALNPYSTRSVEYFFYFPKAGNFPHYPVHVAKNEELIAFAAPFRFNVVEKLTKIDKTSWHYISQYGSDADIFEFLNTHNLNRLNMVKIAFRMRAKAVFSKTLELLDGRHRYDATLWSYSIYHNHLEGVQEYMKHASSYVNRCGTWLVSTPLVIDPVARKTYQHMEYSPLVNARAHQLGKDRKILNNRFAGQYARLMKMLTYKRTLSNEDMLATAYYLLLQDRVEEGLAFYDRIDSETLSERLQYDYLTAYVGFYTEDVKGARAITRKYKKFSVPRWRDAFSAIAHQLDEITGKGAVIDDKKDRSQQQTKLAATETNFDFKVESRKVRLNYQNMTAATVNYYKMDIELLFSRKPFVQKHTGHFGYIRPNATATLKLSAKKTSKTFDLPKEFHNSNVLVEIQANGTRKSAPYYANTLNVHLVENYGHVRVTHQKTAKPLSKVYVKVYARMNNGSVKFFKDGYTDLRGRFDYASLNTTELNRVNRFALLIMSEGNGAIVREAAPPNGTDLAIHKSSGISDW